MAEWSSRLVASGRVKDGEEAARRGWRVALDVALWLGLSGFVIIDAGSNPNRWELVAGLVATTAALVTARRFPLVSLTIAMVASSVVLGSFGGRVPIWEGFLLVAVSYLAGYRQPVAKPMLRAFVTVSLVAVPVALVWSKGGRARRRRPNGCARSSACCVKTTHRPSRSTRASTNCSTAPERPASRSSPLWMLRVKTCRRWSSGRRGLIGLRERVRLVGGTLRAGPRDGGFEVVANLPHDAAPSEESPESQAAMDAEVDQSTSACELERARRDVRRSLIQAIVVPIGLFGVVAAISGVVFLVQWYGSELPARAYDAIRTGRPGRRSRPFCRNSNGSRVRARPNRRCRRERRASTTVPSAACSTWTTRLTGCVSPTGSLWRRT